MSPDERFDRNAAFSMKFENPALDEPDPIYDLVVVEDDLLSFQHNSIAKVLPAEVIDPNNEAPETKHGYQILYHVGSKNPVVARTILQSKDILGSVILRQGIHKKSLLAHMWKCSRHLIECELVLNSIVSDTTHLMTKCDDVIELHKKASHIPTLPQVPNLEQRVVSYLGNGKRLLEEAHRFLCIFYDAPDCDANFQAYLDWMFKHCPGAEYVVKLLEGDRDWIKQMAWCRNALDINHAKSGFSVTINNFKLYPGNKFATPTWESDFSAKGGVALSKPTDLLHDLGVFRSNMLTFLEELFLLCIRDNWDNRFGFVISKNSDDCVSIECPTLYKVGITKSII